ncbi:MAG: coenzyme F420-0:L-glutamate ligase [Eubacteriales bacterium]|nr:coenzyme F420-0:L-glutamate ligase [Eubacteriales bacterium]
MKKTCVTSRGIITPIFKQGDDLAGEIVKSICEAASEEGFSLHDGDIVGVTESVLARTQGNYATVEQITKDVMRKFGGAEIGVVFPIMSRNRFSILLKAFAKGAEKVYVQLSYPCDEVGNELISIEYMDEKNVDPYAQNFDEKTFRAVFGYRTKHRFTGIDYIEYYKSLADNIEIIFSNDPTYVLNYTKNVLSCDIHSRERTKRRLKAAGAALVYGMDDILSESVDGSGYNPEYGLLGSNKATEEKVKLFPRDAEVFANELQKLLFEKTGKHMEVLVYGDGCFKDPVGGIWELADPVVSPGFTERLNGTPNELKIKYFADNEYSGLTGQELEEAMKKAIKGKESDLVGNMVSEGTTPRRYTDLLGSLCDLTSGSGDRGTPVVLVQGYFTNYATE